jgi:hypothetical protein
MRGTVLPLLQYAFMAWCPVKEKARGDLYLYVIRNIARGHVVIVSFRQNVDVKKRSRGSSVSIMTRLRAGGPRMNSRRGQ